MRLVDDANSILREAGYRTRTELEPDEVLVFENEAVIGFVISYPTTADLLGRWEAQQDSFLRRYSGQLHSHTEKSGNVYAVFLAEGESPGVGATIALREVEENLRGTRKIARLCDSGRASVQQSLLPLLPISTAALAAGQVAAVDLADRLPEEERDLWKLVTSSAEVEAIIQWLMNTQ